MFIESPRFPEDISLGISGGASFLTDQGSNPDLSTGNATRVYPLHKMDVTHGIRTQAQFMMLKQLFLACRGKWGGFRFQDAQDYQFDFTTGLLLPTSFAGRYQLFVRYAFGSVYTDRKIIKPVAGTLALQRGGVAIALGTDPGNAAIDTTTGLVQFVADESSAVINVAVGNPTMITTAPMLPTVPSRLSLSALIGADAALLNDQTFNVIAVATNVYSLDVDTTGKDISTSSGVANVFAPPSEVFTASGQFDIPMRFDTDDMTSSIDQKAGNGKNLFTWSRIVLKEWPNPS